MSTRLSAAAFAALFCAVSSFAGTLSLSWATDKEPVSYLPNEQMTFKVQLMDDGTPLAGKTLKWLRTGDDGKSAKGEGMSSAAQPVEIKTSTETPGFVRVEVSVCNADGSPVKDAKNNPLKFEGGAGVQPEKLEGYPEPSDFDAFWQKQKARLAEVPLKATLVPVESKNPKFDAFDVKIDCAGGKPVSGYLTLPKGAQPKSLNAQAAFRGYSVCGADQEFHDNAVTLQINAHGIENGKDPEYYKALSEGALKGYCFHNDENAKPETSYYNGMMLRVMRALEYLKSRPEWNGKVLIAAGGSQGGLQAVTAAALDHDVTQCFAFKPWCCDFGGIKLNRLRGWRPDYADGIAYYDTANMGKRVVCETFITAGLGDYVCPPSGVSVLFNNVKASKKSLEYMQGATHGYNPPNPVKQTISRK